MRTKVSRTKPDKEDSGRRSLQDIRKTTMRSSKRMQRRGSVGFQSSEIKTSLSQRSLQQKRGKSTAAAKSLNPQRSFTGVKSNSDAYSAKRRPNAKPNNAHDSSNFRQNTN